MSVAKVKLASLPPSVRAKLGKRPRASKVSDAIKGELRKAREAEARRLFFRMLAIARLPEPETEVSFHPSRKWRFDYAWPAAKIALEVEGGVWTQGRHTRGSGFVKDMDKYNAAAVLGWRVLRVMPDRLTGLATEQMLRRVLK